jgi:hypothetical protein
MSREECAYTRGAAEYVFSILDEPASRMGSDEEKLHYTQNATLRTLLVFRICPSVGEKVLDNNSKLTGHWIKNIENTMDGPDIDYLEQSAKKYPAENTIHLLVK